MRHEGFYACTAMNMTILFSYSVVAGNKFYVSQYVALIYIIMSI
jgi:hypothetical protein